MKVSEQLRRAIEECGSKRYSIGKETGIPQSTLSRFVAAGKQLRGENIDILCEYLGLELMPKANKTGTIKPTKKGRK
jgi:predicted transcriptional regulator